jgi:leucyl aminopeptidase
MRLVAAPRSSLEAATPLLVLLVDDKRPATLPGGELGRRAVALWRRKVFGGAARKTLLLHAEGREKVAALLLIGMGPSGEVTNEDLRRAGGLAVNRASELGLGSLTIGFAGRLEPTRECLAAVGEGAVLGGYRYAGKPIESKPPRQVRIVSGVRGAAAVVRTAQVLGESTNVVRDLGDRPGNDVTPRKLVQTARRLARDGRLRCKVYGKADLKRMKMNALLAVNQGSAEGPYLIEMEYKAPRARRTICIVGKGLTFDSGGISLKPAEKMEEMKYDMCGAGATLGLMRALSILKPKGLRVIGIVGTTENMPGPAAYKPGDVVRAANGKTIEVINTDAEGRVVLADALHHATRFKPEAIIDMATLTGAIVISLGHEAAGLFCKDDKLAERLLAASARTDERVWRMPTYDEFAEAIKSRVADVKNAAGRWGGSCTAAQFLFHFSGGLPHAHLDIAGTAWHDKKRDYHSEGGTGFGVRLLYDALTHWDG